MTPQLPPVSTHLAEADRWLLACILFFSIILVLISKWSPSDGQTFQVIAQLDTGFAAAFLTRLTGGGAAKLPQQPGTVISQVDQPQEQPK